MNHIFNKVEYKQRRQTLRSNMTEPEKKLWQILRDKQMGVKFRRQHGIGHYIADFYCPELKLVIEVDGESHGLAEAQAYDGIRHNFMDSLGITTLRFTNDEVMNNIEGVHQHLTQYLNTMFEEFIPSQPPPL
jgi:very-short-patch-repair endonuclease